MKEKEPSADLQPDLVGPDVSMDYSADLTNCSDSMLYSGTIKVEIQTDNDEEDDNVQQPLTYKPIDVLMSPKLENGFTLELMETETVVSTPKNRPAHTTDQNNDKVVHPRNIFGTSKESGNKVLNPPEPAASDATNVDVDSDNNSSNVDSELPFACQVCKLKFPNMLGFSQHCYVSILFGC